MYIVVHHEKILPRFSIRFDEANHSHGILLYGVIFMGSKTDPDISQNDNGAIQML
jgi:hypothetical protein